MKAHENLQQPSAHLSLRPAVVIVLFGLTLLTVGLGGKTRVLTVHEVFFAQPAREMLASGDWIIPRIAGVPCTEKPPLTYWMIAAAMTLLGEDSELAVRLPSALAAIITALLIAAMGARWFDSRVGLVAGLMQLSTWYVLQIARLAESDSLLVATVCGAMCSFALAQVDSPHGRRTDRWLPWAFYLAAGLAFLAKGLIGPVVIFSGCGLYLLLSWELKELRFFLDPIGSAIFGVCVLAWPIAAYVAFPAFLDDQLHHHFGRFRGAMNVEGGRKPMLFYFYSILLVMLPWTPLVVLGACRGLRQRVWSHPWWRLAFCWIVPGLALLTASAWKHQHYSAPLLPPLSIVAALGFWQYLAWRHEGRGLKSSWVAAAVAAACALGIAAVQIWPPRGAGAITMLIAVVGMASLAVTYCEHRRWPTGQTAALFATVWLAAAGALTLVMPHHDSYRDHANFAAAVSAKVPDGRRLHLCQLPDLQIAYYLRPELVRADKPADVRALCEAASCEAASCEVASCEVASCGAAEGELYLLAPRHVVEETLPAFGDVAVLDSCPTIRRIMTERDRLTLVRLQTPPRTARSRSEKGNATNR